MKLEHNNLSMAARMKALLAVAVCWLGLGAMTTTTRAQALPEPGVLLYGAVTNSATGAALTNGTVTFSFMNGANVAMVAAQVTNVNGQFLYVVEVPFETVLAGLTLSSNALALPAGSTSVGRGAKFNGTNATILAVGGPAFNVAAANRGLQLRVDLQVTPTGTPETYEAWSTRFFNVPNADPNSDPDSDGRTNLQEYQDGTSPADANSVTRSLAVVTSGSGTVARSPNQTSFFNGATVTLTATPDPGFFFTSWSGGVTASTNPLTLVMSQNVSVTANFSALSNGFAVITNAQAVNELSLLMLTNRATNISTTTLRFALGAGALAGMAMGATNGVFTWTPTEAQGPSSNLVSVIVSDTNNPATFATQQMVVLATEVSIAPTLAGIGNQTVNEGSLLTFTASASDADLPANTLTFSLGAGAPAGASVNASSGVFTWTPTEAQGPSTNVLSVIVTDNGVPSLSATQTFTVTVTEVNTAPVLAAVTNRTMAELTTLTLTNVATDGDLPANTLTFSLGAGAPVGASVNASSGVFTWTPTEAQGPSTNTVTVRVLDNGTPSLSATQSFQVIVTEVNTAPVLAAIGNQTVNEGSLLTFTASMTDADLVNTLTFNLGIGAPGGASVHPTTGVFTWTPTETQGPSTNVVSIIVTDNGTPSLSATQSFQVIVTEVNTAPVLAAVANLTNNVGNLLSFTLLGTDTDIPINTLSYSLLSGPSGMAVNPASGLLNWTPAPGQNGTTNPVVVTVTDSGVPFLSATQSFSVVVPVLPMPVIASLTPTNLVVMRTNAGGTFPASFTVGAANATGYQWSLAGTPIPGETGATLLIPNARRTNNGVYSVAVTGPGGIVTTNATLHVIVPQRVQTVQRLADGTVRLLFRDDDAGLPTDLARLEVHSTTNLRPPLVWTTNVSSLVFSNGLVQFEDSQASGWPRKFYRILER